MAVLSSMLYPHLVILSEDAYAFSFERAAGIAVHVRAFRARAAASRRPALLTADCAAAHTDRIACRRIRTNAGRGRSTPYRRPTAGGPCRCGAAGVFAQRRAASRLSSAARL